MSRQKGFTLIELLIVVAIIGIIAAIAIPSLLRARVSANEAQAIGDTRSVISAEQTYASANCGFFGPLVDLCRTGGDCVGVNIPNYPTIAPEFVGGDLGRDNTYAKSGYDRNWIGLVPVSADSARCSSASFSDYCYHATPTNPGLSGVRGFMGSAVGAIYVTQDGTLVPCPVSGSQILFLE